MSGESNYWHQFLTRRVSRRRALQAAALGSGGLAAITALSCGGGEEEGGATAVAGHTPTAAGGGQVWLGGTFRAAGVDPQSKFDAFKFPTYAVQDANGLSYSRLLKSMSAPADPNTPGIDLKAEDWYRPVPDLAAEVEPVDDTTFIFTLQDGAVWHDLPPLNGRAVVPDDVVKSFDYYRSARPDQGVNLKLVDTVTAVGPNQIQFKLTEAFGPLLFILSSASDLWIYAPELMGTDQLNQAMYGTGPYVMRSYQQGVGAKFDKNPNWWEKDDQGNRLPYIDGADFPYISDKNTEISQYSAGRLDAMFALPSELVDTFRGQNPDSILTQSVANLLNFMFFPPAAYDSNEPPFNDDRVRKAVSLALDREALIDLASGGHGGKKHNLINAGFVWYLDPDSDEMGDSAQYFTRDLAAAKQLLSAAGYSDGLDTELHYTNNAYQSAVPYYNPVAEAVPAMLREAGVNTKLVNHDYQSEWINPDAGIFYGHLKSGFAFALETPVNHPWVQFTFEFTPGNIRNHSHVDDSGILSLIDQMGRESDFDKGRDLAYQIQKSNGEKMYYVPLVGPLGFGVRQAYTRAWDPSPGSYGFLSESFPHFQIDTSRQKL
jgi:peptide/nickel transport system substrate-binding protein